MLRKLVFILLIIQAQLSLAQENTFFTGASLDSKKYMEVAKIPPLSRGDYDNLPSAVSLKKYLPAVGNQGKSGSCVGWATAYAARTLAESHRLKKSIPSQKLAIRFSPAYVYNQVRLNKTNCENGSHITQALKLMKHQGVLPFTEFPYSDTKCFRIPNMSEKQRAKAFRIADYRRLGSAKYRSSLHISTRKALSRANPVVIGMLVGETFMKHRGNGKVIFKNSDYNALKNGQLKAFGGHAMTVIGYDDQRDGGSFQIINSWGVKWGDKGYFWIGYKDFNLWVREAYELIPPAPLKPKPKEMIANMQGQLTFIDFKGEQLEIKVKNNQLKLARSLGSGSRFRAELTVKKNSYVYVVGADDSSNEYVALFPHNQANSAYLAANERMLLPGPTENYFSQLNSTEGTDYFVVLTSLVPLDIEEIVIQLNQLPADELKKKLQASVGERHLVMSKLNQHKTPLFSGYLEDDQILAKIVSIEHTARRTGVLDDVAPLIVISSPEQLTTEHITASSTLYIDATEPSTIKGNAQDSSMIQHVSITGALQVKFSSRGAFKATIDPNTLSKTEPNQMIVTAIDVLGNSSSKEYFIKLAN